MFLLHSGSAISAPFRSIAIPNELINTNNVARMRGGDGLPSTTIHSGRMGQRCNKTALQDPGTSRIADIKSLKYGCCRKWLACTGSGSRNSVSPRGEEKNEAKEKETPKEERGVAARLEVAVTFTFTFTITYITIMSVSTPVSTPSHPVGLALTRRFSILVDLTD